MLVFSYTSYGPIWVQVSDLLCSTLCISCKLSKLSMCCCMYRIFLEQSIRLRDYLQFSMSKRAEERAKGQEFSFPSRHSREGSTDKEELLLTTQPPEDSLILRGWFPECLPTILLNLKKAEYRSLWGL